MHVVYGISFTIFTTFHKICIGKLKNRKYNCTDFFARAIDYVEKTRFRTLPSTFKKKPLHDMKNQTLSPRTRGE